MTLQAFQRALCDMIASPPLCLDLRTSPERVLARYDLSPREQRRLTSVVRQPGMSTNCSLYRNNRITPLYTLLPHTCFLLGQALITEVEQFWNSRESTDLQFKHEIDRFGAFLNRRSAAGKIANPYLEEVLNFELAENALRYLPTRQIAEQLRAVTQDHAGSQLRAHPLSRVVRFQHEPAQLLRLLMERRAVPSDLPSGEFYVLVSAIEDELIVRQIDTRLGRLFGLLETSGAGALNPGQTADLIESGLAIPASLNHITATGTIAIVGPHLVH